MLPFLQLGHGYQKNMQFSKSSELCMNVNFHMPYVIGNECIVCCLFLFLYLWSWICPICVNFAQWYVSLGATSSGVFKFGANKGLR